MNEWGCSHRLGRRWDFPDLNAEIKERADIAKRTTPESERLSGDMETAWLEIVFPAQIKVLPRHRSAGPIPVPKRRRPDRRSCH